MLSIAPRFWPSKPLAGLGRIWNHYLLTMLTWNRRDSTPLFKSYPSPNLISKSCACCLKSKAFFPDFYHSFSTYTLFVLCCSKNNNEVQVCCLPSSIFFVLMSLICVIVLHTDLWQSCQSGLSGTGCSSSVNKVITGKQVMHRCKQITWITGRKNAYALWNSRYTGTSGNHSHSVYREVSHRVTASECPGEMGPSGPTVDPGREDRCWVVHIPFVRMVKFKFLAHLPVYYLSDPVLYSFCANLPHSLIMWLMVSSLSPHSLHLLFCCVLSILALIWLVLTALFFVIIIIIIILH